MPLFDASTAWYTVGPSYGVSKYDHDLSVGDVFCLAGILEAWGWTASSRVMPFLPLTTRHTLFLIYAALLIVSSFAIARTYRHREPRFLVAIAVPWLVWFAFAAQIHERYLLFGAVVGTIAIAVHLRAFAVSILMTLTSLMMTLANMLQSPRRNEYMADAFGPQFGEKYVDFTSALYPHFGWVIIAATFAVVYFVLKREPVAINHGP